MATFTAMLEGYVAYHDLQDAAAQTAFLKERAGFKPAQVEIFSDAPGDIDVLARMLDKCIKLATTITVARYYGPSEDLGVERYLAAFAGDAVGLARTALGDTPVSDHDTFRLHGALLALLRAYLPPRAAKQWRAACAEFIFPTRFAQGWTQLVHLFDLQCVIAELTAAEAHHVKRMDPPSWAQFLQLLEDAVDGSPASSWIVPVLYSTAAQHVITRAAMKSLLTANDPGVAAVVGGPLQALSRDQMRCHNCGELGHFARDCIQPRQQRGGSNVRDGLQALGVPDIQYQRHLLEELRDQVALQDQLVTVQEARAQCNVTSSV